jgi:hypothetical protein
MTPQAMPGPRTASSALKKIAWFLLICAIGTGSYVAGKRSLAAETPPPKHLMTERKAPSVVVAIQALARLHSVVFHMERVVDLTRKEQVLWGLVETHDNILLVAAGDVESGIDLGKLAEGDVVIDELNKSVRLMLPPPEVFSSRLDNERTYVHSRRTGVLTKPDQDLETEARRRAERAIHDGALEAGILEHAQANAAATVRALALSFGYRTVRIDWQGER